MEETFDPDSHRNDGAAGDGLGRIRQEVGRVDDRKVRLADDMDVVGPVQLADLVVDDAVLAGTDPGVRIAERDLPADLAVAPHRQWEIGAGR